MKSFQVDPHGVAWCSGIEAADGGDPALLDHDDAVLNGRARDGMNRCPQQDIGAAWGGLDLKRRGGGGRVRRGHTGVVAFASDQFVVVWEAALVVDLAIDEREFAAGEGVEGVCVEEGDIGILTDFERADTVVEAKLLRGVDGDHGQRLVFGHPAVVNHLGGFVVEVADQFVRYRF